MGALTVDEYEIVEDPYEYVDYEGDWLRDHARAIAQAELIAEEEEAAWSEAEAGRTVSQMAALEDAAVSRVADEIAHKEAMLPNEPQVFLAARNAAEDVLLSAEILWDEGTPYVSEEEEERAREAARAAARRVVYRLLRLHAARRGNPPGFWPTTWAFRAPNSRPTRAPRTRRVARIGSRGDPSEDPDPEPDLLVAAGASA